MLIALRHAHPLLRGHRHPHGPGPGQLSPEVSWHGVRAWTPDWSAHSRLLAMMLHGGDQEPPEDVYIAINAHWEAHELELPVPPARRTWHLVVDTAAPSPQDAYEAGTEPRLDNQGWVVIGPRSALVLLTRAAAVEGIQPRGDDDEF